MTKFGSKQLIPVCMMIVSGVFIYVGVKQHSFWNGGPTAVFVPTIISVIMLIVSIFALVRSVGEEQPYYPKENNYVILSALAIIPAIFVLGMIPTLIIYVITWLKWVEKTPWKQTLIVLTIIMAIVLGVFVLWLGVPFPKGVLLDTFLN